MTSEGGGPLFTCWCHGVMQRFLNKACADKPSHGECDNKHPIRKDLGLHALAELRC